MFVKPALDTASGKPLHIRFPRTRAILPADGAEVDPRANQSFWQRRLRDGDVIRTEPSKPRAE
ncbi:MAG: DUF2635 domain-containing protein [Stellaceae bacterium]